MPPCQNLGFCTAPDECSCPDNYEGPQCQFSKTKPCLDKPPTPMNSQIICNGTDCLLTCNNGFEFPSGSKEIKMVCVSGYWTLCQQLTGKFQKVPDCQRNYIICLIIIHQAPPTQCLIFGYFFVIVSHSRVRSTLRKWWSMSPQQRL